MKCETHKGEKKKLNQTKFESNKTTTIKEHSIAHKPINIPSIIYVSSTLCIGDLIAALVKHFLSRQQNLLGIKRVPKGPWNSLGYKNMNLVFFILPRFFFFFYSFREVYFFPICANNQRQTHTDTYKWNKRKSTEICCVVWQQQIKLKLISIWILFARLEFSVSAKIQGWKLLTSYKKWNKTKSKQL